MIDPMARIAPCVPLRERARAQGGGRPRRAAARQGKEIEKKKTPLAIFYLIKTENTWGVFHKYLQGIKSHKAMQNDPCNILQFTKLVWPILEQLNVGPLL